MSYIKNYQDFILKNEKLKGKDIRDDDEVENGNSRAEAMDADGATEDQEVQMEHSYSRDCRPVQGANGLATRTLMIHRPPQCPSCHTHPIDDNNDLGEANHPPIPSYNETEAKVAMIETVRIAKSVNNPNADDDDWEQKVNRNTWSPLQNQIFDKITRVFDLDQLARLATVGKQHEPIQKRVIIDKSAQRMRQILASIAWDSRITQWLHGIFMDSLPPTYMATYLDILQTLKSKVSGLVEKMVFRQAMSLNQGLLEPILENQWEPIISLKSRKLPQTSVLIVIPSIPTTGPVSSRTKKLYQLFATMTHIVQINMPVGGNTLNKQPLDQVAEQLVSLTRLKIKELRNENAQRHIILAGFNAGAALALQVALVEQISSVICMGFAYNTINGVRGAPDDHILDVKVPIIFVIGQNSARASQEEIESLREKMHSESSLVVVGSADDVLRVPKSKRKIEGVTQSMVDNMVMDEIFEFVKKCIISPPGPRTPNSNIVAPTSSITAQGKKVISSTISGTTVAADRKRKQNLDDSETPVKPKYNKIVTAPAPIGIGRPRTRPLPSATPAKQTPTLAQPSNEDLNLAIQSILGESDPSTEDRVETTESNKKVMTTYEIVAQSKANQHGKNLITLQTKPQMVKSLGPSAATKIKMIPSNQFIQIKPPIQSQSKIYTIKMGNNGSSGSPSVEPATPNRTPQIFTLKTTPTQYIPAQTQPITSQFVNLNQQKFKILKSGTTVISSGASTSTESAKPQTADLSNIFDMPIIFADSDGNLHDSVSAGNTSSTANSPNSSISGQFVIQKDPTSSKPGTFVLNNSLQQTLTQSKTTKPNKVVFINRNTMKPCPNILSKTAMPPLNKYSKVVVTNPKGTATSLVTRASGITPNTDKPLISAVKQINIQTLKTAPSGSAQSTSGNKPQYQPIIINVDPQDKLSTGKNIIKLGSTNDPMKQTILVKAGGGGLKPISVVKTSQFINRNNLTVRKLVNIVPNSGKTTTVTKLQSGNVTSTTMSTNSLISKLTGSSIIETPRSSGPKIITITTSAGATTSNTLTTSASGSNVDK